MSYGASLQNDRINQGLSLQEATGFAFPGRQELHSGSLSPESPAHSAASCRNQTTTMCNELSFEGHGPSFRVLLEEPWYASPEFPLLMFPSPRQGTATSVLCLQSNLRTAFHKRQ